MSGPRDLVPTGSSGCRSSTSPRCSRRVAAAAPRAGRACSTSGAATPRSGRRRTSSRRCARRRRARTSTATRRSAACRGCARRSPRATATVYGVELDPEREVAIVPGTKTAIVELALALGRARRHDPAARSRLPRLPLGRRARGRRARPAPARPGGRLGARPRRGAARGGRASSTTRRTRARSARRPAPSRPRSPTPSAPAPRSSHDAAYIDLVFDGRAPESFLATPGAKDVGVEMWTMSKTLRHGRLADRLRRRQRRDRRAHQPA